MLVLSLVALRKESVDRNDDILRYLFNRRLSLSARRAWIEIAGAIIAQGQQRSLSARRAWIEIAIWGGLVSFVQGSLSAKRAWIEISAFLS